MSSVQTASEGGACARHEPLPLVRADRRGAGWLFDCLDQQLFIHARLPAMRALVPGEDQSSGRLCYLDFLMVGRLAAWSLASLAIGLAARRR